MYREIKPEELKIAKDTAYQYFIDYNHPLATGNSGRVYYHRHVVSLKEGRWISSKEHVHHIDENKLNNNPNNLEILSNSDHTKKHKETLCIELECPACSKLFVQKYTTQLYCSNLCSSRSNIKLDFLSKEDLEYLIWTEPYTQLANKFNCSDTGIRKWAERLKCMMPPSRFHSRTFTKDKRIEMYKAALAQLVER